MAQSIEIDNHVTNTTFCMRFQGGSSNETFKEETDAFESFSPERLDDRRDILPWVSISVTMVIEDYTTI